MFLKNLHIDSYRKKSFNSLDKLIEEKSDYILDMEQDTFDSPENIFESDTQLLVQTIISHVNNISKIRDRVLVKLKLFIEDKIEFQGKINKVKFNIVIFHFNHLQYTYT